MYTYGIVKVETYSYNKRDISSKYSCIDSFFIPANTRRLGNPKMSVVYHGAPTHIYVTPYP